MLTRKQHELLLFIHERLGQGGVSPSFDEMKDALGLKSKSGIHRLITGLEERGFIRRLPHRARALEVLRLPEGLDAARSRSAAPKPKFQPNVIKGDFAFAGRDTTPPATMPAANETVQLPLYGRIAAGTPIEALRDNSAFVDVPASMLTGGDHYALEVSGDSMIEAGILDHDTIIIQRCDAAENGTIVVALVDEGEVTLKRLRRKGNTVALEPANAAYETRIFGADRVRVQGKLVGLVRKY
ncbi:LexA family transcriptional regulator [Azospirillum sp. TSH7]|jgi:repressor LexA|uniref:transcriptional repressor LexA n=1 Tax=unclassified Azospirillum TaxID=2630922 RepID=UPI000D608FEC|nr:MULTISPECIES: transcriptional repressor LexA [unclassified Azospirillum]PWC59845.1 LexA family transcriptional regulator [Azospirillum sp. TSH20]PWC68821.1 LexA family transcriptional regulator [Azospirillum sp. TSH7]